MSDTTHFPPEGWVISEIYMWLTERDDPNWDTLPDLQWSESDLGGVVRGSLPVALRVAISTAGLVPSEYRNPRNPSVHFPYTEMIAMSVHGTYPGRPLLEEVSLRADEYEHILFYLVPLTQTSATSPETRARAIHLWPGLKP